MRCSCGDLGAHMHAKLGIEVGQRLVEQKHLGWRTMARPTATRWRWPPDNWPGLALQQMAKFRAVSATRSTSRGCALGAATARQQRGREAASARSADRRFMPERHRDIVEHGEMRVERVGLEHHRQMRALGAHAVGDCAPSMPDLADDCGFETGDDAQQRGFAAARWTDQRDELAVSIVRSTPFRTSVPSNALRRAKSQSGPFQSGIRSDAGTEFPKGLV